MRALRILVVVVVSITLAGSGAIGQVVEKWSVREDCTPLAPGDTRGGVGSATVDADSTSTSVFVIDNNLTLEDETAGEWRGNVVASPVVEGKVHLDVAGKLNFLVADRTVDPVWFNAATPKNFIPTGQATGQVENLYKVAVDTSDGSVFASSYGVAGIGRYTIVKYSATGSYITEFGAYGSGNGQFAGAVSITVNPADGSVFVGDGTNNRVQKFTTSGGRTVYTYSAQVGGSGTGNGQFGAGLIPVAVDSSGNVYAGDRGNARIQKFNSALAYQTQVAVPGFSTATPVYDMSMSPADILYVSLVSAGFFDGDNAGRVRRYSTSLAVVGTDIVPPVPQGTRALLNIAADATGFWAYWGTANGIIKYNDAGVEQRRWYSGYPFSQDVNTGYSIAIGNNGDVVVGFKTGSGFTNFFPANRVTVFNWASVPLSEAILGYMETCDPTLGGMTYSYDVAADPAVVLPAWSGDVWAHLKEVCTAHNIDIYADNGVIHVADAGARIITLDNTSPIRTEPVNLFGGQQLIMYATNPVAGGGVLWSASEANTRYQIDVGQRRTVAVSTSNYPVSVDPLVPTDSLPVLPGQYYVIDSTGAHVPAASWVAAGASVKGTAGSGVGQVEFTLQGPNSPISGYTGPFTFADGNGTTATGALVVTGTGVFTAPQPVTFQTGANPTKTTQQVARTIRNFAIDTLERLYQRAPMAIDEVSGVAVTVTLEVPTVDLLGFGSTMGATFLYNDSRYRITNAVFGALTAQITATRFVSIDMIDTVTAGLTIDQRDAIWAGYSIDDRTIKPLALTL